MDEIEPGDLRTLLGSDETFACIDVRERGEFALEQIEGVTPLARGTLEYRVGTMIPEKDIPTVVCCDDGRRSRLAAATLAAMGYTNVQVLRGGLVGWRAAGLPTIEGWGVRGKRYGEQVLHEHHVPEVTAEQLAARRQAGEPIIVIDPRTEEEYLRGHIPGAYHVPTGQLPLEIKALAADPDTPIVVACAGRTRGIFGADCLRQLGYRNAAALRNGGMGWRLAGFELERGPGRGRPGGGGGHTHATARTVTAELARREEIRALPVDVVARRRAAGEPHYLVDVRLPEEYRAGHVPGSISLPSGQFALMHENFLAVRQLPVIILADDDVRPVWAAALCQDLGFPRVFVLEGGLAAWAAHGHPLETGAAPLPDLGLETIRRQVAAVTPRDLRSLLDAPEVPARVLDVRSGGEFGFEHVPGARWLARGSLELRIAAMVPDRETPLVTMCDNGVRATLAAATLRELGYRDVRYLDGGLAAWKRDGLPTVDGVEGADGLTIAEAQADVGSTLWDGALARTRADMEAYLSWEEALTHR